MIVDGYVRVSQVAGRSGESFISPSTQREQIAHWAKVRGVLVAHVFEELDESGGRRDRPLLEQAIARVERGETDGLVVAYLTRFGRSLLDGLAAIQRITEAGGRFVTVQEGEELDFSTYTGRLLLRWFLSLAEWDLDRIRATWASANQRAIARGVFIGTPPFGYRRGSDSGLAIDPVKGPIATELFQRWAHGERSYELQRSMMERGITTATGMPVWRASTVAHVVHSRVYLGEAKWGSAVNPHAHPALIDEHTWEVAQVRTRVPPLRRAVPPSPLSGILRCAGCQRPLITKCVHRGASCGSRAYVCEHGLGKGSCPAPARVLDRVVEPYIEALFWQERPTLRPTRGVGGGQRPTLRPTRGVQALTRLHGEVERRERELAVYRDNARLPITIGADRFAQGLAVRVARLDRARAALSRAQVSAATPVQALAEVRALWGAMGAQERGAAIGELIECAFVSAGKEPIHERIFVCLRGDAPPELLPFYARPASTQPFKPSTCRAAPHLRSTDAWSEGRLRDELTAFLDGRDEWPAFAEFEASGRALMHAEVERHGGARRWAALLGLPYVAGMPSAAWSERRVAIELREYLAQKTVWPTWPQFQADGRRALRTAVRCTGGAKRWAAHFDVELPAQRGEARRWSYAEIARGVQRVAGNRATFPPRREFIATGIERLYDAMMRLRLRPSIANDLGLALPDGRLATNFKWTDAAIETALNDFLANRNSWPADREFRAAGLAGLICAVRRAGKVSEWAGRYKLRPPNHWDEQSIEAALDELVYGREYWAPKGAFLDAGFGGLHTLLEESKTMDLWRERYGLDPLPPCWNDRRIAATLDRLVKGRDTWPRASDPEYRALHKHLTSAGTRDQWARRFGFRPPSPGRVGSRVAKANSLA